MSLVILSTDPAAGDFGRFLGGLRTIDQVGFGLAAVLLLLGTLRGLWWQVIRLVGLLGAGILARCLAPRWSPAVSASSGLAPLVSQGLVWFAVFVLGLAAASLLGLVGKKSLDTMHLGLADRLGGALAGVLTGLLLHAAMLVGLSYLGPQPWTADLLRGTRSQTLLRLVSTRLPVLMDRESQAAREIRRWLGSPEEETPATSPPAEPEAGPEDSVDPSGPDVPAGAVDERPVPVEASAPRERG